MAPPPGPPGQLCGRVWPLAGGQGRAQARLGAPVRGRQRSLWRSARSAAAENNGAGGEEKGKPAGEAAAREDDESSLSLGCQRAAAGARGEPPTGRLQLGAAGGGPRDQPESCAPFRGARELASLASEGNRGGRAAPGGPPESRRMPHEEQPSLQRPRYGCKSAPLSWEPPISEEPPV